MPEEFYFGVRAQKVEQAVGWVESATGLKSEARESSDWGGDYYAFSGPGGEYVRLVSNRDIYDDQPVIQYCDAWPVAILLESAAESSLVVQGLLKDSKHFVLTHSE
jgi:hypothetical protein